MKQEAHLQVFDLILEAKSPIFIGCGKSYMKKEYLFNPRNNTVSFLDEQQFFTYLAENDLADAYEGYLLHNTSRNLREFLLNVCQVSQEQIDRWTRFRVDAADALDERRSLKEIRRFIRNGNDQIYVPGSSIKGALRTALLKEMLLDTPVRNPDSNLPFDRYGSFEENYFHTLSLKKDRNQVVQKRNPLNSIMQGVLVSDSLPIPDSQVCLTRKIDELADETYREINICRECIKPGTRIYCTVTLDQSILHGAITKETLENAIAAASAHYQKTVTDRFPHAWNYMNARTLLLGGGVGFHSKTVVDPYYEDKALEITASVLDHSFKKHNHRKDVVGGLSPRTLKQTVYDNMSYPYGVCEVFIR